MSAENPVAVNILEREYLIGCSAEERPGLIAAANLLDSKMREMRNASPATSLDRIAVMAALNMAHDLLQLQQRSDTESGAMARHLEKLRNKLDGVLSSPVK